ncbi:MAG: hypothetical protein M0Q94_14015 [Candidatus Cloacimonetes bacterium]|nr:hypothetical protein [Candidatus Cloacimonadota bacterium]
MKSNKMTIIKFNKSVLFLMFSFIVFAKLQGISIDDFLRVSPDDKALPRNEIRCEIDYDKDFLYFNWYVEIDSLFSKGRPGKRNTYMDSDYLRVQIITSPKDYYAYVFFAFPFGNLYDGIRTKDLNTTTDWNSNYSYICDITDSVWVSQMKIPFANLRFTGKEPYSWKVILNSFEANTNHLYSAPAITTGLGTKYFEEGLDLLITEKITKNQNYTLKPYMLSSFNLKNSKPKVNAGIDIEYKPKPFVNVKATVKPDFTDTPLDAEQDIYNLKNEPFYSDNRYFFTEDINSLDVSSDIFYTRRIIQPELAVKINGNTDNYSFGALYALDKNTDESNTFGVVSVKPKFKNLEINFASINMLNKYDKNTIFQVKPILNFNNRIWLSWSNYYSFFENKENSKFNDIYSSTEMKFVFDNSYIDFNTYYYGKDFIAEMGRIYETGYYGTYLSYTFNQDNIKKINNLYFSNWINYSFYDNNDFRGLFLGIDQSLNIYNHLQQSTSMYYHIENFNDKNYHNKKVNLGMGYYNLGQIRYNLRVGLGKQLLYMFERINLFSEINNSLTYSFKDNFDLSLSVTNMRYYNFKDGDVQYMDNEYYYLNSDISYFINKSISLVSGIRYNNYNHYNYSGHLGFYSNLNVEIGKMLLYLGYNRGEDKYMNKWEILHNLLYLKLRISL